MFDPTEGRFLSMDPLSTSGADLLFDNPFAYARNNPTNFVQPSGYAVVRAAVTGVEPPAGGAPPMPKPPIPPRLPAKTIQPPVVWTDPGWFPSDLESEPGRDCTFECFGHGYNPNLKQPNPNGFFCQGIKDENGMLKACREKAKQCDRITVSGHGCVPAGVVSYYIAPLQTRWARKS